MLTAVLIPLVLAVIVYALMLVRAALARRAVPGLEAIALGAITNFFDTLGVGSFAPTMAWLKFRRLVPVKPDGKARPVDAYELLAPGERRRGPKPKTAEHTAEPVRHDIEPPLARDQGGIVEIDMPIDASNVMYLHNGKPVRLGYDVDAKGHKVRVAKLSGGKTEVIK